MTKIFARQWRRFRRSHNVTQKQLALVLGISRRAVQYIESGEKEPHISTQRKFDEILLKHANQCSQSLEGEW